MKLFLALIAFLTPSMLLAANNVSIESKVFVERTELGADGKPKTVLEDPKKVTPGDKLVFELSYRNGGAQPATDFVITNPLSEAVAYAGTEGAEPVVSVDGGKTWGKLASLKVVQGDGTSRAAAGGDVTHVRWTLAQPIAAGQGGKLSFRGVVR